VIKRIRSRIAAFFLGQAEEWDEVAALESFCVLTARARGDEKELASFTKSRTASKQAAARCRRLAERIAP
jgi:hypothetical protein